MTSGLQLFQVTDTDDAAIPDSDHLTVSAIDNAPFTKDSTEVVRYLESFRDATVQTTDATPTVIMSSSVLAEGQEILVKVNVLARRSTLAAGGAVDGMWVAARRASGGNITLTGTVQGTFQTNSGSATVTLVANTSTQKIDVQVTGVVAETWDWYALLYEKAF